MASPTPEALAPTDLDGLVALHAQTTKGPWVVLHETHQDTKIVQEGRGVFGLIAEASTAPDDYGRANAAFIAASHRLFPELAAELAEARQQLAER
jgi:hypothetical protein